MEGPPTSWCRDEESRPQALPPRRRIAPVVLAVAVGASLLIAGCTSSSSPQASPAVHSTADSGPGTTQPIHTTSPSTSGTLYAPSSGASSAVSSAVTVPARTTAVPAPGGGNVDLTVPSVVVSTRAPLPLTAADVALGAGLTATLGSVSAVQISAVGPGEIGGPGLAVTVRIRNQGKKPVDVGSIFVNLQDSAGNQALPTTGSPSAPLTGSLAPGQQAQGTYVFTISQSRRSSVEVLVSNSTSATTVAFVGKAM